MYFSSERTPGCGSFYIKILFLSAMLVTGHALRHPFAFALPPPRRIRNQSFVLSAFDTPAAPFVEHVYALDMYARPTLILKNTNQIRKTRKDFKVKNTRLQIIQRQKDYRKLTDRKFWV